MSTLVHDIRFALRMLIKNPALTAVAVLTLGVAIGANTTIFSVVNSVVLQPLPYPESDRLIRIHTQFSFQNYDRFWVSPPEYFELRDQMKSFESIGAWADGGCPVSGGVEPVRVPAAYIHGALLQTIGVQPAIGRLFSREESTVKDTPTAVVLSHKLWQRGFGGDPDIVGKTISADATPMKVIGVMPEGFNFPTAQTEIWVPMALDPAKVHRGNHLLNVVARLKRGSSLAKVRSELDSFMAWSKERYGKDHANSRPNHPVVAFSLYEETVRAAKWSLWILQGAVAFLLLIAAANIASLLLARAEARNREIAIRAAIGAPRRRIVRQLLTESLVLGLLGAGLGLAIAVWGVDLAVSLLPDSAPRKDEIGIDGWVLGVGIASSLGVSLLFGLAPALHARVDGLHGGLREAGLRATMGGARLRLRRALVVLEIVLAVVLVVGCGLMLRSFSRLQKVELGFDPRGLVTMHIELPKQYYPLSSNVVAFWDRLTDRVRELPGVQGATVMSGLPPYRQVNANDIFFVGMVPPPKDGDGGLVWNVDFWQTIGDDFFETMKIRLISGRKIERTDDAKTMPVVVVNQAMAAKFWPGRTPIGQQVVVTGDPGEAPTQTVVGIVADVKQQGIEAPTGTEIYLPLHQVAAWRDDTAPRLLNLVVRAEGDPRSIASAVRRVVADMDPRLAVADVKTMDELLWTAVAKPRFFAVLLGAFAGIAVLLAAIGIFGVMSYSITQRTRELGIRMALGAPPPLVRWMVLREGMVLVVAGVLIGVGAAAALNTALSRILSGMLYGVEVLDPWTFLVVPMLIIVIGGFACWLPAARATRVDPMLALRHD